MVENTFLHKLLNTLSIATQKPSKCQELPEWVENLLHSRPGQVIKVMNTEERLIRKAQEELWQMSTKT